MRNNWTQSSSELSWTRRIGRNRTGLRTCLEHEKCIDLYLFTWEAELIWYLNWQWAKLRTRLGSGQTEHESDLVWLKSNQLWILLKFHERKKGTFFLNLRKRLRVGYVNSFACSQCDQVIFTIYVKNNKSSY